MPTARDLPLLLESIDLGTMETEARLEGKGRAKGLPKTLSTRIKLVIMERELLQRADQSPR
jgi:hypothetical protein